MIDAQLIGDSYWLAESPDTCDNVGLCCLTCPHYEACDHHYEEDAP